MRSVPAVLAALLLAACADADPIVAPVSTDLPVAHNSVNASISTVIDVSLLSFVPCANGGVGELVQVAGSLHIMTHFSTRASGGLTFISHVNPQRITGSGLSTGDGYIGNGVTKIVQTVADGDIKTSSFVNNFLLIGPGGAVSLRVHQVISVAFDASGRVHVGGGPLHIACG